MQRQQSTELVEHTAAKDIRSTQKHSRQIHIVVVQQQKTSLLSEHPHTSPRLYALTTHPRQLYS